MESRTRGRAQKRRSTTELSPSSGEVEQENEHVQDADQPQENPQPCQQPKRRKLQKGKSSATTEPATAKDGGASSKTVGTQKRRSTTELSPSSGEVAQEEEHMQDTDQPQENPQPRQQPKRRKLQKGKSSATTEPATTKDGGASSKTVGTRKRKSLNKSEKNNIKSSICNLRPEILSTIALANVRKQLPVNLSDLKAFCDSVNSVSVSFLTDHLQQMFVTLYEECSKCKERHIQLQIKWLQHCSYFLMDKNMELSLIGLHPSDPVAESVVGVRSKWNKVCVEYCLQKSDAKKFLILFCDSVFEELLRQCHRIIEPSNQILDSASVESEDVYFRFGGAAICSMLHSRYAKIKSCSLNQKEQVSQQITILQQLSVHKTEDKDHVPDYLKYRDEGFMYFPCRELLPFLRTVDTATTKKVNDANFSLEGADILTVVVESLHSDPNIHSLFLTAAVDKVPRFDDISCAAVDSVFQELARKLCHTRIQEYLDSFKHKGAANKGSATLAGQNLRDSLLTHHINLKSKQ